MTENAIDIAGIFNDYFVNVTKSLNIETSETCQISTGERTSDQFQDHPSIKRITESVSVDKSFSFSFVSPEMVFKTICRLKENKSVSGPFSNKIVRMVADIVSVPISKLINLAFQTSNFPQSLKLANVTPIFKKGDKFLKENHRPISIL